MDIVSTERGYIVLSIRQLKDMLRQAEKDSIEFYGKVNEIRNTVFYTNIYELRNKKTRHICSTVETKE